MFIESFKITVSGVGQIFLLGAMGYFLQKRNFFGKEGLGVLSRIVIVITLPALIVSELVENFTFSQYANWWVFPLVSIAITLAGLLLGLLGIGFFKGSQKKLQFLSLVTFQNSGYLPLALVAAMLSGVERDTMFIYIFLFLLGFNLIIWSLGVYLLTFSRAKKFELGSLFSPPVVATLASLAVVFLGAQRFLPGALLKPVRMVGECTVPLALFVVGGNLAQVQMKRPDAKGISLVILLKLILLPLIGLLAMLKLHPPYLLGLLIMMELAMPSATSLSIIAGHYKKEDLIISQGIFFSHLAAILSVPVFLSLYFAFCVVR